MPASAWDTAALSSPAPWPVSRDARRSYGLLTDGLNNPEDLDLSDRATAPAGSASPRRTLTEAPSTTT
ncbi:hypothetical protein [Streptomyces sp. LN590]|uniref:hypothetical protein n=1 Tax=unclassified Streptomyces TaxID=2593676 RepID=UPI00371E7BF3